MRRLPHPSAPILAGRRDGTEPHQAFVSSAVLRAPTGKQEMHKWQCCERAVLQRLCCSPKHCTPPLQLVTNGRDLRDRIPPSFAFIKRSPRKCDFFSCEQRYQKLMKSELHHFCVHFLFSLPLELSFPSLSQAATDSHVLRQERFNRKAEVMHLCLLPSLPALATVTVSPGSRMTQSSS